MDPRLFVTIVGYVGSALLTVGLGLFVFLKGPRKSLNVTFFLFTLSACVFFVSHVIGVNIADADESRRILFFNVNNIFLIALNAHWILNLLRTDTTRRRFKAALIIIYSLGGSLFLFLLLNIERFLLPSRSVLYFPNYYVPGPLYALMTTYFVLVLFYFVGEIFVAYRTAGDFPTRLRLKYVLAGLVVGYGAGLSQIFLLYGIPVDPLISVLTGLYSIPWSYAILKYNLLDITIVAKRALVYAFAVTVLSLFLMAVPYGNVWIDGHIRHFPSWLIPFFSAVVAVFIGRFVWRRIKELDMLKYEFITVVSHKFRTPLTHIKWSAEELLYARSAGEREDAFKNVTHSTQKLVELTDVLIGVSEGEVSEYEYKTVPVHFSSFTEGVVKEYRERFNIKGIGLNFVSLGEAEVLLNEKRFRHVIVTLLENALTYTNSGGRVDVVVENMNKRSVLSIKDSGKGIPRDALPHLFSEFFRDRGASVVDTEGFGMGLFISKKIVERHGGDIRAESDGEGTGTTFIVRMPILKHTKHDGVA